MSIFDEMLNTHLDVGERKRQRLEQASNEKKKALEPGWENLAPDNYRVIDGDTIELLDSGRRIRLSQNDTGSTIDTFESDERVYQQNPERLRAHKRAYAEMMGKPAWTVTTSQLVDYGRVQKNRLENYLAAKAAEDTPGIQFRSTGLDASGKRETGAFRTVRPDGVPLEADFFAELSARDNNSNYNSEYNRLRRFNDIVRGEHADHQAGRGSRSFRDAITDQPINLLVGAGRMANDLAQAINTIAGNNTEGEDAFFQRNRELLEGFKARHVSPQQLRRERMAQKEGVINQELFSLRQKEYEEAGDSPEMAKFKAGTAEFTDTVRNLIQNPGRVLDATVESLPYMIGVGAAGRVVTNAAVKQLQKKALNRFIADGVSPEKIARGMDKFLSSKAGQAYISRAATTTGVTTVGITEGLSNSADVYSSIVNMSEEEAMQSERYQALRFDQNMSHREAVKVLAEEAFNKTLIKGTALAAGAALVTGAGGFEARLFTGKAGEAKLFPGLARKDAGAAVESAAQGATEGATGGLIRQTARVTGRAAAGVARFTGPAAAKEAVEEGIQSGGGEFLSQLAEFEAGVGPSPGSGVGQAAAEGAVIGAASGFGAQAVTGSLKEVAKRAREGLKNSSNLTTEAGPRVTVQNAADEGPRQPTQQPAEGATYNPRESLDTTIDTIRTKLSEDPNSITIGEYQAAEDHFRALDAAGETTEQDKENYAVVKTFYDEALATTVSDIVEEGKTEYSPDEISIINRAAAREVIREADKDKLPENLQTVLRMAEEITSLSNELVEQYANDEANDTESQGTGVDRKTVKSVNQEKLGDAIGSTGPGVEYLRREMEAIMADPNKTSRDKRFNELANRWDRFYNSQKQRYAQAVQAVKEQKNVGKIKFFPERNGKGGTRGLAEQMGRELEIMKGINQRLATQYAAWTQDTSARVKQAQEPDPDLDALAAELNVETTPTETASAETPRSAPAASESTPATTEASGTTEEPATEGTDINDDAGFEQVEQAQDAEAERRASQEPVTPPVEEPTVVPDIQAQQDEELARELESREEDLDELAAALDAAVAEDFPVAEAEVAAQAEAQPERSAETEAEAVENTPRVQERVQDAENVREYVERTENVDPASLVLLNPRDNRMLQDLLARDVAPAEAVEAVLNAIQPDPERRAEAVANALTAAAEQNTIEAASALNEGESVAAMPMPTRWQDFMSKSEESLKRFRGGFVAGKNASINTIRNGIEKAFKKYRIPTSLRKVFTRSSNKTSSLFAAVPNIMEIISDPTALRKLTRELKLNPRETKAMHAYASFYRQFTEKFYEFHRQLKLDTLSPNAGDQLQQYPLHYFEDENGDLDPNVVGAMALEAMLWLATSGPGTVHNDDSAIRSILGREDGMPVLPEERAVLEHIGTLRNQVANELGNSIIRHLNLRGKQDPNSNPFFAEKVGVALGGTAIAVMKNMGRINNNVVSLTWFNSVRGDSSQDPLAALAQDKVFQETGNEAYVSFIQNASDITLDENANPVYVDTNQALRDALEGGGTVFARLFGAVPRVRMPVFDMPVDTPSRTYDRQPDLLEDTAEESVDSKGNANTVPRRVARSLGNIPERMRERLLYYSQRKWRANTQMIDLVGRLQSTPMLQMMFGYMPEEEIQRQHSTLRAGLEGRNRGILRDLQAALEWNRAHGDTGFYFNHKMIRSGRIYIDSNVINPQASKLHRFTFVMDEWKNDVSTKDIANMTRGERKTLENFKLAIALGFGVKVDKQTRKTSLAKIETILNSPEMTTALQVLDKEGTITDPADLAALAPFLSEDGKYGGEGMHSLAALQAWHQYTRAEKNSSIRTFLPMETDGVTNGYIAGRLQTPMGALTETVKNQLRGGGVIFKGDAWNSFGEYVENYNGQDNYQEVSNATRKHLLSMSAGLFSRPTKTRWQKVHAYIQDNVDTVLSSGLMPSLNQLDTRGPDGSKGRNWAKNPLTVVSYGSSPGSVTRAITAASLEEFYTQLGQAAHAENPAQAVSDLLNRVYSVVNVALAAEQANTGKDSTSEWDAKKPYSFTPEAIEAQAKKAGKSVTEWALELEMGTDALQLYSNAIRATYGTALNRAIEEKMGDLQELRTLLNAANKMMNIIFVTDFVRRLEALRDINGTDPGPQDRQRILNEMWREGVVPSVQMALSRDGVNVENLELTNYSTDYMSKDSAPRTLFNQTVAFVDKAFVGLSAKRQNGLRGGQKSLVHQIISHMPDDDIGVSGVVKLIHALDGVNNSDAWGQYPVLNVHDAIVGNFNTIEESTRTLNQGFFDHHNAYSLPDKMLEALGRMTALTHPNDSRLGAQKRAEIFDAMAEHLKQYVYPRAEEEGVYLVGRFLDDIRAQVDESNAAKQELFAAIRAIGQFSLEGATAEVEADPQQPLTGVPTPRDVALVTDGNLSEFRQAFARTVGNERVYARDIAVNQLMEALSNPELNPNQALRNYIEEQQPTAQELFEVVQAAYTRSQSPAGEALRQLSGIILPQLTGVEVRLGDGSAYVPGSRRIYLNRNTPSMVRDIVHETLHVAMDRGLMDLRQSFVADLQAKKSVAQHPFQRLYKQAIGWATENAKSDNPNIVRIANEILQYRRKRSSKEYQPSYIFDMYAISEWLSHMLSQPSSVEENAAYDLYFTGQEGGLRFHELFKDLATVLRDQRTGTVALYSTGQSTNRRLFEDRYTALESDKVQQIWEDLANLEQGPVDPEAQAMLNRLMGTFVIPGLQSLTGVLQQAVAVDPDSNTNIGEIEGDQIRLQAAGNKLTSNVDMSLQETAAHEYVHAILKAAVNGDHFVRKEARRLFLLAKESITVEDFLPEVIVGDPAIAREKAQERYDYIFNNPDGNQYHEFLAIGLTNLPFAKALAKLDNRDQLSVPERLDWSKGILSNLLEILQRALAFLSGQSRRSSRGSIHEGLYQLAQSVVASNQREQQRILDIEQGKDTTTVDRVYAGLDRINDAGTRLAEKITESLSNAVDKPEGRILDKDNPRIVDFVRSVTHSTIAAKNEDVRAAYNEVYRGMGGTKNNIFFDLLREVTPWQENTLNWIQMLRKSKVMVDKARQEVSEHTRSFLNKSFDRNNYLSQEHKQAITRTVLNTDLASLIEGELGLNMGQLADLLNDPAKVAGLLRQVRERIKTELDSQNASALLAMFENQGDSLANYMINGVLTMENPLLNAHNIVNQWNLEPRDQMALRNKPKLIELVDKMVTLMALQKLPDNDRRLALDMVNHEMARTDIGTDNGFSRLVGMASDFKKLSRDHLFDGQPGQMIKGYTYEIFDGDVNVEVVDDTPAERARMAELGMYEVAILEKDNLDPTPGRRVLYKGLKGLANYNKSIVSLTDLQHRGGNLFENANYRSQTALRNLNKLRSDSYKSSKNQFRPGYRSAGAHMAPVFNNKGEIVDYRYLMSERNKQKILKKQDPFDKVLPRMFASITDRTSSKVVNEETAGLLWKEYDALKDNKEHRFLEVGAATVKRDRFGNIQYDENGNPIPDRAARDMWNLLPYDMQQKLTSLFGAEKMYIRDDVANLVLGFRKMSLANLGENRQKGRGAIWGRHSDIVKMAERYWQEVIQLARIKIAVLTPRIVVGNVASNTAILLAEGVRPEYIRKKSGEAISAMRAYQKDVRTRDELRVEIGSRQALGKDTRALEAEFGRLEADIKANPVHELVDAGLFTSIAEDLGANDDTIRQHLLNKAEDKARPYVPSSVITAVKEGYMLPGSRGYRAGVMATQYGDFVARYVKYRWDTERKGKDHETAINEALAAFIYYDIPQNRYMQYMNDSGLIMFTKFFLRIQPIVARIYTQNPGYAFGVLAMQQALLPKPFNENIMNYGMGSGLTQKPTAPWNIPGRVWDTLRPDEPALLQWILNPFGL